MPTRKYYNNQDDSTTTREIIRLTRDLCHPSMDQHRSSREAIAEELNAPHFDARVRFDKMGVFLDGSAMVRKTVIRTRISTRSASATRTSGSGSFEGKVEDGVVRRGACDEKGSTPDIYGLAAARDLGLLEG